MLKSRCGLKGEQCRPCPVGRTSITFGFKRFVQNVDLDVYQYGVRLK